MPVEEANIHFFPITREFYCNCNHLSLEEPMIIIKESQSSLLMKATPSLYFLNCCLCGRC